MPSDVQIESSAYTTAAANVHCADDQSIYLQRYNALRDAGFDELTANKYSSIYSSVNEVIDAILSQSLLEHLSIENGQTSRNPPPPPSLGKTSNKCEQHLSDSDTDSHNESNGSSSSSGGSFQLQTSDDTGHFSESSTGSEGSGGAGKSLYSLAKPFNEQYEKSLPPSSGGELNSNLLVTILKDGLFDDDASRLEDEGVAGDQASTSPSTSSLSSSGASSLLLDIASSPSSFSSFSSTSISTTPPHISGSTIDESLLGSLQYKPTAVTKSKDAPPSPPLSSLFNVHLTDSDLKHRETNRMSQSAMCNLFTAADGLGKSAYQLQKIDQNDQLTNGLFGIKNGANGQFLYGDHSKYCPTSTSESFNVYSTNCEQQELLFEPTLGYSNGENGDTSKAFKYSDLSENAYLKNYGEETSLGDLLAYSQPFRPNYFDYEHQDRNSTNQMFTFDKPCADSFEAFKSNHYNQYENESYFHHPKEQMTNGQQQQFAFQQQQQQQRTFADIAASSVIGKNGEHYSNANECNNGKQIKSSQLSNLTSTSANNGGGGAGGGFYSLFNNGICSPNQAYFENGQAMCLAKKQAVGAFKPPMSPMGSKYSNGQQQQQPQTQQAAMLAEQVTYSLNANRANNQVNNQDANALAGGCTNDSSGLNRPANLMAYKGLWVCNVSPEVTLAYLKRRFRRFGHFTGIQTFERRATNGSNIVFVHYDNPYSPVEAISSLHNYNGHDLCADPSEPLKLRFAPSMEQSRAGQLPTLEQARKIVERSGECFNWRLSSGCHRGARCQLKHVPINKEIDSQPWVKALKKKNNDL